MFAMRRCADSISARVSASRDRVTGTSEIDRCPGTEPLGFSIDMLGRSEILDREAQGLEQGHLVFRPPSDRLSNEYLADLGDDVVVRNGALGPSEEEVARLGEGRFPPIDEQA